MITLGGKFGVLPQQQKRIKHGIYWYLNHPMYLGIRSTFTGISLATQSWEGLIFTQIVMVPVLIIKAYYEDRQLLRS